MKELIALFILVSFGTANDAIAVAGEAAIQGRVVITKVMTKKRVTLPGYDLRGATVNSQNPDKSASIATTADEFPRVVIYLEGSGLAQAAPVRDTLAQKNRHFDPEIVVVPVGSTVSFPMTILFSTTYSRCRRSRASTLVIIPRERPDL